MERVEQDPSKRDLSFWKNRVNNRFKSPFSWIEIFEFCEDIKVWERGVLLSDDFVDASYGKESLTFNFHGCGTDDVSQTTLFIDHQPSRQLSLSHEITRVTEGPRVRFDWVIEGESRGQTIPYTDMPEEYRNNLAFRLLVGHLESRGIGRSIWAVTTEPTYQEMYLQSVKEANRALRKGLTGLYREE